jgi:hypothetical protein
MRIDQPAWLFALFAACGCVHTLAIDQTPPPIARTDAGAAPLVIGVKGDLTPDEAQGYVEAIAKSLQLHPIAQRVIYPWTPASRVDVVADVKVAPEYKGAGMNFLVNFPGFLVFAPAWYGYIYHANPRTRVELHRDGGSGAAETIEWENDYEFRQADIGRTWTEISWIEVGAIAFIGGIVFTRYDTDQTPVFIKEVAPSYGETIATLIGNRLAGPANAPAAPPPTKATTPPSTTTPPPSSPTTTTASSR